MAFTTGSGRQVTVGQRLAVGGEGEVFAVTSPVGTVFKKYLPVAFGRDPAVELRLRAMIARRPAGWRDPQSGEANLAWPAELVLEDSRFVGFLMPAVDMESTVELHRVTNPSDRRSASGATSWVQGFTWKYLVRTAANLAYVTQALHDTGVVVGDFNERNVRATRDARVTLLDCDSMQISDPATRGWFFCRVGRPEYTPPELFAADWGRTVRRPSSDLFALAIHIYQLLLEGEHPFRGIWSETGDKPPVPELARRGIWVLKADGPLSPRPSAIGINLPKPIIDMFRAAFEDGAAHPDARPTAHAWQQALSDLEVSLRTCRNNAAHVYPRTQRSCPWCRHARKASPLGSQRPLPPAEAWPKSRGEPRPSTKKAFADEELIVVPGERVDERKSIKRRIELGSPEVFPVTKSHIKRVKYLADVLSSRKDLKFCVLWITPTFHDGKEGILDEVFVKVNLGIPEGVPSGFPKVWGMLPDLVEEKIDRSRSFQGSGGIKPGSAGATFAASYQKHETFIQAFGLQSSQAYWKFTRTQGREIRGSHKLEVIVGVPRQHTVEAWLELYGTARWRRFGIVPSRRELENDTCKIILTAESIEQILLPEE